MKFNLITDFIPTGDQPSAIQSLINGIKNKDKHQTLLGVTGSGKTFTVANVISTLNKPTLVLAHNKTLAAQLYSEFKGFFPDNLVEYFVSYYDYYQPEAYIPTTGVYIEKDLSINEEIEKFDPVTNKIISKQKSITIYPANIFVTSPNKIHDVIKLIQDDLVKQYDYFNEIGNTLEANRIKERTEFDMEMIKELGYCSGIENYSRYFDGRKPGTRPFCLLDYFPDDYLTIIDESHVTIPQVRAMYGGDRSRKENLVEYGFRLPAAMDNRPLKFEEFESLQNEIIYVSATPADYELEMCEGVITEQIIRPTGLLDPKIQIKPTKHQIDDLIDEIQIRIEKKEKILVTTLTKKMAEELTSFLTKIEIRSNYIHSDVDTIERVEIMQGLREDEFDVLIGVNLLREGLDLPEVSLVAVLDADKEGFLRSHRSLTQTIGRAARHVNGVAILYADKITNSIKKTIDETNYRRSKQIEYNKKNSITPRPIVKSTENPLTKRLLKNNINEISENIIDFNIPTKAKEFDKKIRELRKEMEKSAKELDFKSAALYRDQIKKMKELKSSSS